MEILREGFGDFTHVFGIIPSRKGNHRGDLEETNLERVRGSNLHALCTSENGQTGKIG